MTNQRNRAAKQRNNNVLPPDILFNCPFPGTPGQIVRTNDGLYKFQYVTIRTGSMSKRELLPVYDRTAPANIRREQKYGRRSFPQGRHSSPKHDELVFTHLAKSAIRRSLTLKDDKLKKQNRYQSKLLQQAKKVNISHLVDGKLAKDSIDQEIKELKAQNSALHVKIGKMNETHGHTVNQFVDSIVSLSKLRNEINLIQIGRKRQTEELKQIQKEREFDFIENCMTKFDNFCHISPTSVGQDFPTPDSQLMRTDGILSRASTTFYYVFNQMRRILGLVAGMQLMDPDQ